jgi:hypothetical protein
MTRRSKQSCGIAGTLLLVLVALAALAIVALGPSAPGTATQHRDQLIPVYDNANPVDWQTACSQSNGSRGGSYIIANAFPSDRPGPGPVQAWSNVIKHCYQYGRASVIGYVWTNYGRGGSTSIPRIERQIKT